MVEAVFGLTNFLTTAALATPILTERGEPPAFEFTLAFVDTTLWKLCTLEVVTPPTLLLPLELLYPLRRVPLLRSLPLLTALRSCPTSRCR